MRKQILGFVLTGLLSTLLMFVLYVILYQMMNYQYAYLIAYSISVAALYLMNSRLFQSSLGLPIFFKFSLIYLFQYLVGAISLEFIVTFGFPATFAPLLIIIILLPITYMLNKILFAKYSKFK